MRRKRLSFYPRWQKEDNKRKLKEVEEELKTLKVVEARVRGRSRCWKP